MAVLAHMHPASCWKAQNKPAALKMGMPYGTSKAAEAKVKTPAAHSALGL